MALTVDQVYLEVNPRAWRAFCQNAAGDDRTSARALGLLVEAEVRRELRAVLAARQREFRAKQRAARDA